MINSDLSLQLARPPDASIIAKMSRDLVEYGLRWRWTAKRVEASIRAPDVNVLVARIDDQLAGFAIMHYGEHVAHLDLLAVAREYQRNGVARQLLQWLEKCAVVAGILRVVLEVREGNHGARRFYERMGYQKLVRLPGYYQNTEAALRMGRDLSHPGANRSGE
jgi:ribosomal-protein-alanine N-acetyltransferase